MRLDFNVVALALLLAAAPAMAEQASSEAWAQRDERMTLRRAGISFPATIAGLSYKGSKDFSHPGEGLDTSIRYETPDGEIFATVYVYYPAVAHAGLAEIATEAAIRGNSPEAVEHRGRTMIEVGGVAGAAIRTDFGGYQGRYASSAAFVKVGRWMVKIRVSGPEPRRSEVDAATAALLAKVGFEGDLRPVAAAPIDAPACTGRSTKDAKLLPEQSSPGDAGAMVDSLVATLDAAGESAVGGRAPLRIGRNWCRSYAVAGNAKVPLLRATDDAAGAVGKSVLFALYNDAGGALEIVLLDGRHLLLHHQIGMTTLLGTFDGVPSDAQMAGMLAGTGAVGPIRARIRLKPEGGTQIDLPSAPQEPTV
jgi:hypothetical protein